MRLVWSGTTVQTTGIPLSAGFVTVIPDGSSDTMIEMALNKFGAWTARPSVALSPLRQMRDHWVAMHRPPLQRNRRYKLKYLDRISSPEIGHVCAQLWECLLHFTSCSPAMMPPGSTPRCHGARSTPRTIAYFPRTCDWHALPANRMDGRTIRPASKAWSMQHAMLVILVEAMGSFGYRLANGSSTTSRFVAPASTSKGLAQESTRRPVHQGRPALIAEE